MKTFNSSSLRFLETPSGFLKKYKNKYNLYIYFIIFIFILLIIYLLIIKYYKRRAEFFQNAELDKKYNNLTELRKKENKALQAQYKAFAKKHPGELKDFLTPRQIIESKVKLSNVNYSDTIKKFYEQEKKDRIKHQKELANKEKQQGNIYNLKQYNQLMLNNNKKKLFKKTLKGIEILTEDCFKKCNAQDCIKLDQKNKLIKKCFQCNSQKNRCFHKSIIGGNCDDCDGVDIKDKMDCGAINNFGSPNPKNLDDLRGVSPYYFFLNDNSPVSPFNKKCVFSWQTGDAI